MKFIGIHEPNVLLREGDGYCNNQDLVQRHREDVLRFMNNYGFRYPFKVVDARIIDREDGRPWSIWLTHHPSFERWLISVAYGLGAEYVDVFWSTDNEVSARKDWASSLHIIDHVSNDAGGWEMVGDTWVRGSILFSKCGSLLYKYRTSDPSSVVVAAYEPLHICKDVEVL